jgi:DNA-binding MarR family transcriptional regulator
LRTFTDTIVAASKLQHEMTVRQLAVLMVCARTEDQRERQIHALADFFETSRPVIHRASSNFVDMGFMSRSQIPGDRRTCVLTVTRAGHRFIQEIEGQPVVAKESRSAKRRAEAAT